MKKNTKKLVIILISISLILLIIYLMIKPKVTFIVISPIGEIKEDTTYQVYANALDQNNKNIKTKFNYMSSDTNIFIVSENGLITAKKAGKAFLIVKDNNGKISQNIEITIIPKEILPTKISFKEKEYTIKIGESINFEVLIEPEDTTNKDYIVTLDNDNVELSNNTIKGIKVGKTILTVKLKDLTDTCTINVLTNEIPVEKIKITSSKTKLTVGDKIKLSATISPDNATNKTITYSTNDSKICTNNNEEITAVSKGTCTVTAKAGDITSTIDLTIENKSTLQIHMFKGEGYYDDCILIKSDKATIFIDGGRAGDKVVEYLKGLKITKLDAIMGSHLHDDHISAHTNILDNFTVKAAYYPDVLTSCRGCDDRSKKTAQRVNNKLYSKGITPKVITPGNNPQKVTIGDLVFYFLGPIKLISNTNENSSIVILKFGNNQFMFTGDAESKLMNYSDLKKNAESLGIKFTADVLKFPHHGNATLNGTFIKQINPKYVLVPNNGYSRGPSSVSSIKDNSKATIYCLNGKSGCDNAPKTNNIILTSDGTNITIKN